MTEKNDLFIDKKIHCLEIAKIRTMNFCVQEPQQLMQSEFFITENFLKKPDEKNSLPKLNQRVD